VRRGQHYVQPALDPYGRPMRVVVDGNVGAVVSITPAAMSAVHPPSPPYVRYGMRPPRDFDDEDDADMVPPRPVPGVGAPAAVVPPPPPPSRQQFAARPPAKPVPRPRPATAPAVAAVKQAAPETTASMPPEAKPVEAKPEPAAPAAAAPATAPGRWENEFPQFAPLE
jgi:hypothetical protein